MSTDGTETSSRVVFLHMPKTGGMTLREIINHQYPADAVATLDDNATIQRFRTLPKEEKANVRVVQGHLMFGMHHWMPGSTRYITFLRDPVDRAISHYYFVRRKPNHPMCELANNSSLVDFVLSDADPDLDNGQTRLLSSLGPDSSRPCGPEHFEEARAALTSDLFIAVGITERYDESLVVIQHALGWTTPRFTNANVTLGRPSQDEITPEVREALAEHNHFDVALYELGRQRLEADIAAMGNQFNVLLDRLHQRNGALVAIARFGRVRVLAARSVAANAVRKVRNRARA